MSDALTLTVGFRKSNGERFSCDKDCGEPNVMFERAMYVDTNLTDEQFDAAVDALLVDGRVFPIASDNDNEPECVTLDAVRHD
jgi:hypothetical protein